MSLSSPLEKEFSVPFPLTFEADTAVPVFWFVCLFCFFFFCFCFSLMREIDDTGRLFMSKATQLVSDTWVLPVNSCVQSGR